MSKGMPMKLSQKQKGKQREVNPASSKHAPENGTKETSKSSIKTKKPEKTKVRRLHVSGLPLITEDEVKTRFKSFGDVLRVDGLGKLDGNGNPLRYAFLDINITKSKLNTCMNLLNGSIWKGATLRIAESRPTILEKLDKERAVAAKASSEVEQSFLNAKKRKRAEGVESESMEIVNVANVKDKEGWKLDPTTSTPIFPLVARPDHPLPPIPQKDSKKMKKEVKKEKIGKDGKKKKEKVKPESPAEPPTRAHRIKIDPTQWKPKHHREGDFKHDGPDPNVVPPSLEATQTDLHHESSEEASSQESDSSSESEASLSDEISSPQGHDSRLEEGLQSPSTSEQIEESEESPQEEGQQPDRQDEDASAERKAQLALAESILSKLPPSARAIDASPKEVAEGHNESDSEDSEDHSISPPPIIEQSSASETSDGESETGETEADQLVVTEKQSEPATASLSNIHMQSLTEMFKPQEATTGFTLGDMLNDFELDEATDIVIEQAMDITPVSTVRPLATASTSIYPSRTSKPVFDPREPLFFPFPLPEDSEPDGVLFNMSEADKERLLDRSWTGTSTFRRFKRTQTLDEITSNYESIRKSLSEQVRKRHREAVKKRKRQGGRSDRLYLGDDV